MAKGWIKISRAILDHPVVGAGQPVKPAVPGKPVYSRLEAWLDLLMLAKYAPQKAGKNRLERGDFEAPRRYLASRWNWSEKTVRGYLDKLLEWEIVAEKWQQKTQNNGQQAGQLKGQQKGQHKKVLSVCNYDKYQDPASAEGPTKGPLKGQLKGQQKGQSGASLSDCNHLENSPPPGEAGPAKGPAKGPIKEEKKDINNTPPTPPGGSPPPKRGSRLPEGWEPDAALLAWAAEKTVLQPDALARETEIFKGHFYSASNAAARKIDWRQAWQVWMRREDKAARQAAARQAAIDARYGHQPPQAPGWQANPEKYKKIPLDRWLAAFEANPPNGVWPEDRFGPYATEPECVMPDDVRDYCMKTWGTKYAKKARELL